MALLQQHTVKDVEVTFLADLVYMDLYDDDKNVCHTVVMSRSECTNLINELKKNRGFARMEADRLAKKKAVTTAEESLLSDDEALD